MYCDFEEYVKNRKPDKLSLKNLVNPSLEKPYDKDELALLSHLAVYTANLLHLLRKMRTLKLKLMMTTTMMTFRIF